MTTPQTATLTDWLMSCIAEDEAALPEKGDDPFLPYGQHWSEVPFPMASASRAAKEIAAKRAIVEAVSDVKWTGSYAVRDVVLGHLASVYADRPGFREEWR